jgi:L-xylulokinase
VFCKDYLRAQLCGDISTDPTDAGLGALVDVPTHAYDPAFYDALGIPEWHAKLPHVGASTEVVGHVSTTAEAATGLLAGTPVVRGIVDVVAAAIASGVVEPSQLSVVAGTFSINSTLHATPRIDTLPLLQAPYPVGGYCLATEGSPTSASNFEWYCKAVLGPVVAAAAEDSGRTIYEVLGDRVQACAMQRRNDILFLPFLFGGPGGAPAAFIGLQAAHDGTDVVRAIFEGIAFAHRLDIERLLGGRDRAPVTSIRLAGGAARSQPWSQMFADVLGLPVEITEGTELGARGTAMSAAVGLGLHADWDSAVRNMVRVVRRLEPRPDWQALYERKYARFKRYLHGMAALQQQDDAA